MGTKITKAKPAEEDVRSGGYDAVGMDGPSEPLRAVGRINQAAEHMGRGATDGQPDPATPDPAIDEDAVLDTALGDLEADLQQERAQRESQLPPTVWLTVITLQPTDPPRIT